MGTLHNVTSYGLHLTDHCSGRMASLTDGTHNETMARTCKSREKLTQEFLDLGSGARAQIRSKTDRIWAPQQLGRKFVK